MFGIQIPTVFVKKVKLKNVAGHCLFWDVDEASHFPDWVYHLNPADMTNAVYHRLDTALLHFKVIFRAGLKMSVSSQYNLKGNLGTSNDIIAGNGMISGLKQFFIVVVNYQQQHYIPKLLF